MLLSIQAVFGRRAGCLQAILADSPARHRPAGQLRSALAYGMQGTRSRYLADA